MDSTLRQLINTTRSTLDDGPDKERGQSVITVSETVSVAVSLYETVRNTLEYDEEHLLRRNAIRRFLKRRAQESDNKDIASDLLRELIWAHYLPNKKIPEKKITEVATVLDKHEALFDAIATQRLGRSAFEWLLDVVSTEIEYTIAPPLADEALASFAYKDLQNRLVWKSNFIDKKDRDLQLYVAVHRAILKSNIPTLRFRLLSLYYPDWVKARADDPVVKEIADDLPTVINTIEAQIRHKGGEPLFRLVRSVAVVFHIIRDLAHDAPDAFEEVVTGLETDALDGAVKKAAHERYNKFHSKLRRSVLRAVFFLFLTKFVFALIVEYPYERFVLKTTHYTPLLVNILFHPFLLGVIGLSVRIPEQRNTATIQEKIKSILSFPDSDSFSLIFKHKGSWSQGKKGMVFNLLYFVAFAFTIFMIAFGLSLANFNTVSIVFFLFFLSLVMFLGFKIRNTRRELLAVETSTGFIGTFLDILFLPVIRAGRWMVLRAPRINVILFFFDFIIEAPFKAAFSVMEGWLAFLKEKKEEI